MCNQFVRADRIPRHNITRHGVESPDLLKPPTVQCTRCHNRVLHKRLVEHLERHHGVNFHPACGWHPLVAAMRRDGAGYWLIDGLNIVRLQGKDAPRFDILLALTYHLLQENVDFLCVFDASARPCLREFQGSYVAELCRELIHRFPGRFSEVPAGTVADDAILDIASFFGPKVITNDQYRDHTERHPWLETNREEMLSGVQLRQDSRRRELLLWKETTIPIPPFQGIRSFADRHMQLLAQRESKP